MLTRQVKTSRLALRAMSSSQHTPTKFTPSAKDGEVYTPTPKKVDKGKGKQRESIPSPVLSSALQEAFDTPITPARSSFEGSFDALSISQLPPAHYALTPHRPPNQPRILSQLTRATLPTATLTYAAARARAEEAEQDRAESSVSRRKVANLEEQFPDLDPTTGMPLSAGLPSEMIPDDPPRQLQRTITDLLAAPKRRNSDVSEQASKSAFDYIPSLPFSIPGLTRTRSSSDLRKDAKRAISTSNKDEAWTSWASGWWGSKQKVDGMMDEDDRADTVEEEKEKIKRKCWL
jgi:triacylglycerol lipase